MTAIVNRIALAGAVDGQSSAARLAGTRQILLGLAKSIRFTAFSLVFGLGLWVLAMGAPAQAQFLCTDFNTGTAAGATAVNASDMACGTSADANSGVGGDFATAVGANTQATGESSTAVGGGALALGTQNTSLGALSGQPNIVGSGTGNTSVGFGSGFEIIGDNNTATGRQSGQLVHGDGNSAYGQSAGSVVTGDNNTALGTRRVGPAGSPAPAWLALRTLRLAFTQAISCKVMQMSLWVRPPVLT